MSPSHQEPSQRSFLPSPSDTHLVRDPSTRFEYPDGVGLKAAKEFYSGQNAVVPSAGATTYPYKPGPSSSTSFWLGRWTEAASNVFRPKDSDTAYTRDPERGGFALERDLIPPSKLKSLEWGRQYCLMGFTADSEEAAAAIKSNGLQSEQYLAFKFGHGPLARNRYVMKVLYDDHDFRGDPESLYLKPLLDWNTVQQTLADKQSVVLAIDPSKVTVFSRAWRDPRPPAVENETQAREPHPGTSARRAYFCESAMPLAAYRRKCSELHPGETLDPQGYTQEEASRNPKTAWAKSRLHPPYNPEVPLHACRIRPSMFVRSQDLGSPDEHQTGTGAEFVPGSLVNTTSPSLEPSET